MQGRGWVHTRAALSPLHRILQKMLNMNQLPPDPISGSYTSHHRSRAPGSPGQELQGSGETKPWNRGAAGPACQRGT